MNPFCTVCNEPFNPHNGSAGFCSDECAQERNTRMAEQEHDAQEADRMYEEQQELERAYQDSLRRDDLR